MANSLYEHTVARAFHYLTLSGYELDANNARLVLQIIDSELAHGEEELLPRVMIHLEQRLKIAPPDVQPATPPIRRTSIGYG